jgi:septal ring factor EnvC (AmiA/AmiB activator)
VRLDRRACKLLVLIAAVFISDPPALAQTQNQQQLNTIKQKLATEHDRATALELRSQSLDKELVELRQKSIEFAQHAQESEVLMSQLELQLIELHDEAIHRESLLNLRRRQLSGTLGALERLSLNPPRSLLIGPGNPLDTVRSAVLLRTALPRLASDANALRQKIDTLEQVKNDIRVQSAKLARSADALAVERAQLTPIMQRKAALQKQTVMEGQRVAKEVEILAGQAQSLRDLMARLGDRSSKTSQLPSNQENVTGRTTSVLLKRPEGIRPFPDNDSVVRPVQGRVDQRYGERGEFGNASRGITIATREHAQIVAPHDGKVVFAGSFRRYGQILIIEHGGGYHTVLAGLAQIDCVVGQWLLAGEPVGSMGRDESDQTALYVELRRNGQPINPLPWMTANEQKVRG